MALVVQFDHHKATDATVVGGKAVNLAVLASAGFRVPPGFCITTGAYELAVGDRLAGLVDDVASDADQAAWAARVRDAVLGAPMPAEVHEEVLQATGGWATIRPSRSARRRQLRILRSRASPDNRTPSSTSSVRRPWSRQSAAAGRRCGPTGRSTTASGTGSTSGPCGSGSSCSGWSRRSPLVSCSPRTR